MAKFNMKWQNAKEPFSKSTLCEIVKGEVMRSVPIIDLFRGMSGILGTCNNENILWYLANPLYLCSASLYIQIQLFSFF